MNHDDELRCLTGAKVRRALQRFNRRWRGMPEHIVAADGDDRVFRMHGCDERRAGAIGRTVVADLQHVGVQIDSFVREALLGRNAGIP